MERTEGVSARFMQSENSKPWNERVCLLNPPTFCALLHVAVRTAPQPAPVLEQPDTQNSMPKTLLEGEYKRGSHSDERTRLPAICTLCQDFPLNRIFNERHNLSTRALTYAILLKLTNFSIGLGYKWNWFVLHWEKMHVIYNRVLVFLWEPNDCMKKDVKEGRLCRRGRGHAFWVWLFLLKWQSVSPSPDRDTQLRSVPALLELIHQN